MGSLAVHLKATYLQARICIWMVVVFILLGRLAGYRLDQRRDLR
ncbi:hypothetical protein [Paenibacillus sp. P22]|nr:hypothetical protein [Paenibacillus sp. P22]CDN45338.1 hypothetical protein BN871_HE_00100 [Paenibacillus sp. P22]